MTTPHTPEPRDDDDTNLPLEVLQCLVAGAAEASGEIVNEAVAASEARTNTRIDNLVTVEGLDVARITQTVETLNALFTVDEQDDATTAANVLQNFNGMDDRLDALEGSTAVSDLSEIVTAIRSDLNKEAIDRAQGDAANAQDIAEAAQSNALKIQVITGQLDTLREELAALGENNQPACDCEELNRKIALLEQSTSDLTGADARQAQLIKDLQDAVVELKTNAGTVATAQATAEAAQQTAQTALQKATEAKVVAERVATDLADLKEATDNDREDNGNRHTHHVGKAHFRAIDCNALVASFTSIMRNKAFRAAAPIAP